jgi:hypothetical protein
MHWLTNYAFGARPVAWIALAVVVVLSLAALLAARRFYLRAVQTQTRQRQS